MFMPCSVLCDTPQTPSLLSSYSLFLPPFIYIPIQSFFPSFYHIPKQNSLSFLLGNPYRLHNAVSLTDHTHIKPKIFLFSSPFSSLFIACIFSPPSCAFSPTVQGFGKLSKNVILGGCRINVFGVITTAVTLRFLESSRAFVCNFDNCEETASCRYGFCFVACCLVVLCGV